MKRKKEIDKNISLDNKPEIQLNIIENFHLIPKKCKKFENIYFLYDELDRLIYQGEIIDDKKNGIGILTNVRLKKKNIVNFVTIKGFFKDNFIIFGEIIDSSNNLIYKGEFKNNIPHGIGILKSSILIKNIKTLCFYRGQVDNFCPIGYGAIYDYDTKEKIYDLLTENSVTRIMNIYESNIKNDVDLLLSISK